MAALHPLQDDPLLHAPDTPVAAAEAPIQADGDRPPRLHLNAVEGGLAAAGLAPASPGRAEKRLVSGGWGWEGERGAQRANQSVVNPERGTGRPHGRARARGRVLPLLL